MATDKKSFLLYCNWEKEIEKLSDKEAGMLFKAVLQFSSGNEPYINDSDTWKEIYFAITEQIVFEWGKLNPKTNKYHWNYKGGITPENKIARNSELYKKWRYNVFERDNYTCVKCRSRGGILNAHHIKPFAKFPELRFNINNGITLCWKCHIKEHKI